MPLKGDGSIKTYQDLLEARKSGREQDVINFIRDAIVDHKSSPLYKTAVNAQLYYDGENLTINEYKKIIYDLMGRAQENVFSANHKIASKFFGIAVDQEVSYLLGNGVSFKDEATKGKLGDEFDEQMQDAGEFALVDGVAFGFWNLDHVELFRVTEFAPLEDEENGALSAGIRFIQIAPDRPLRVTLYELDGFTEYIQRKGEEMELFAEKRAYILHVTKAEADPDKIYRGENYPTFPIVPLKNNRKCKSELIGRRNTIDALDLSSSNMVNNVDEGNLIYWVMRNCAGMSETDAVRFIERVMATHIAWADGGEDGSSAEPHAIEAPYEGTMTTIDMVQSKLFSDFMALDTSNDALNSSTATGLKFRYANLDLKCDKFERQVTRFIKGILRLAGIKDAPTYTRNRIINAQEEMQTLMLLAPYVDEEYVTTKGLTILGDGDQVDAIMKRKAADALGRFRNTAKEITLSGEQGKINRSIIEQVIKFIDAGEIEEEKAVEYLGNIFDITSDMAASLIKKI